MRRTRTLLVAVLAVLSLLGAACSDDDKKTTTGAGAGSASGSGGGTPAGPGECASVASDPGGSIAISGSSTVAPISTRAADCFNEGGATTQITVDGPGTGDGFKLFCAGDIDIADASRKIKDDPNESQACAANGVKFIEIKLAFDGLTVMTNPGNSTVECLSFEDMYALMGPESQGKNNWKDAQALATELGSDSTLPDLELDITAPGEESGTYDSFVEIALEPIAKTRTTAGKIEKAQEKTTRPDYSSQSNDDAIIQGISGPDGSFGWVGFAFADQAGSEVKKLEVSKKSGADKKCVAPSPTTIADGSYPLSRSLYIYVNVDKAKSNAAIAPFIDYYLANAKQIVEDADYIALPSDQLSKSTARWEARTEGTESS